MRNYTRKEDIENELASLRNQQKNGKLSLAEEKNVIRLISELESSIEFAQPLEAVELELTDLKKKMKELNPSLQAAYDRKKKLDQEVQEIQADLESVAKNKEDAQKVVDPVIEAKKKEYDDEIDRLKEKKKKLREKFNEEMEKYHEEQDLI